MLASLEPDGLILCINHRPHHRIRHRHPRRIRPALGAKQGVGNHNLGGPVVSELNTEGVRQVTKLWERSYCKGGDQRLAHSVSRIAVCGGHGVTFGVNTNHSCSPEP